jgi:hypothetical protein
MRRGGSALGQGTSWPRVAFPQDADFLRLWRCPFPRWSVVPSLASFWLVGVEPGPASLLLCLLLPACYVVDKARANYLPVWYLTLRGPVTLLATFGLLLTATYYIYLEADRVAAAAAEAEQREQQQQLQQQQQQQQPQAKAA